MKNARLFCWKLVAALFAALTIANSIGQDIRSFALSAVTKFSRGDDTAFVGFGLIVGRESNDYLWIATAAHVVFEEGFRDATPRLTRKNLKVNWEGSDGEREIVGDPIFPSRQLDLAFVKVSSPIGVRYFDRWWQSIVAPDPSGGEEANIASYGARIMLSPVNAKISISTSSVSSGSRDKRLSLSGLGGILGQSGSPVVTRKGVVGLYIGIQPNGVDPEVIPISTVHTSALRSMVKWQLTLNDVPSAELYKFCVIREGETQPRISFSGPSAIGLDNTNCGQAVAAKYTTIPADQDYECFPEEIQVTRTDSQVVLINCRISVRGAWSLIPATGDASSPQVFVAQISGKHGDVWNLEIPFSSLGKIEGQLRGNSPLLFFEGSSGDGAKLFGRIRVEKSRMTGTLTHLGRQPFELILRR